MDNQAEGSHGIHWTSSMSTHMLLHLTDVVAGGTKTSTGFKKVHLNACARSLNEHFKLSLTGDQICNHLRYWKRKWQRITLLKHGISGALWDEENFIIGLAEEHYAEYIQTHQSDAPFLNKPIDHYNEMAIIFGNSLAAGQYAKGSNEPLAEEVTEIEDDVVETAEAAANPSPNGHSAPKAKRAKTCAQESEDKMIATFSAVGEKIANAIVEAGKTNDELPEGLWDSMKGIPGFEPAYLSHYYAHLVENVRIARAFHSLNFANKLIWIAREEIGEYQSAYEITKGLLDKYGRDRVLDTPITEAGFTGIGVGARYQGLQPVVQFMTFNFLVHTNDHIINCASKLNYISAGQISIPIVFRGPNGVAPGVSAQKLIMQLGMHEFWTLLFS
ncbi:hypothetical protein ACQ4PT_031283 [Festuca glaucescens]